MADDQDPTHWDGQLPQDVSKNVDIWWEVFPNVMTRLPHKLVRIIGGAKQAPSRETIGKVIFVAYMKEQLQLPLSTLLNDWGCFCQRQADRGNSWYLAGTTGEKPQLILSMFSWAVPSKVPLIFQGRIDPSFAEAAEAMLNLSKDVSPEENEISVVKYQSGPWEHDLDNAFKAAMWLMSNREQALASIWGIGT